MLDSSNIESNISDIADFKVSEQIIEFENTQNEAENNDLCSQVEMIQSISLTPSSIIDSDSSIKDENQIGDDQVKEDVITENELGDNEHSDISVAEKLHQNVDCFDLLGLESTTEVSENICLLDMDLNIDTTPLLLLNDNLVLQNESKCEAKQSTEFVSTFETFQTNTTKECGIEKMDISLSEGKLLFFKFYLFSS